MRKSFLRLYAPFIGLALAQALFIAFLPSNAPDRQEVTSGPLASGGSAAAGSFDPATGETIDPTTGEVITGATSAGGGTSATGRSVTGGTTGSRTTATGAGGAVGAVRGDTSHCSKDGRQHAVTYHAPACVAKWIAGADNGGETYQGVTKSSIKIVLFSSTPNEQVDAILATQGLAASKEETEAFRAASLEFLHKRYEFYGRKIELVPYTGDCPTSPPAPDKCKIAAREVIKMKPFMVVWGTPLYASVFDEWFRAGIPSIGGWHFDDSFFNDRRPFRYDIFMDGTQSADHIAEYYCKKLRGKPASNAGQLIHREIGSRTTQRKLGIVVPEIEANVLTARRVASLVSQCEGGAYTPPIFTYESDINRAREQTKATVLGLIAAKVTTVTCMCDPIAPVFFTKGLNEDNYFPEHLLPGLGLLDYDVLGRLYDSAQWVHAFGPSHLGDAIPLSQSDAAKVWRDVGRSGEPCNACNLPWAYFSFVGSLLQGAGPDLNPLTMERGILNAAPRGGWAATGGRGDITLAKFGPKDYTGLSDVREAYWSNDRVSPIDNKPGGYISLERGRRYDRGQWGTTFSIPAAPS